MRQIFSNNASALLAASIDDVETVIQVASGFGALFPNPSSGEGPDEFFAVTLENADGDIEICYCTDRNTDLLTVVRGQEGTIAQAWVNGLTRVEGRVTAGTLDGFLQKDGGTMGGDIFMEGNIIDSPFIAGGSAENMDEIVGTPIRGASGDNSNEFVVPPAGGDPTIGGSPVLTEANLSADFVINLIFPVGSIILWYGDPGDIPTGFALCDGTNGTPDMRDRYPVGAGDTYTLGQAIGQTTKTTSSDGGHTHALGATALTEAQIPAHNHRLYVYQTGDEANARPFGTSGVKGLGGVLDSSGAKTYGYREATLEGNDLVETAGGGGGGTHTHTIATEAAHTHTVDVRPATRALYFIMKVA